LFFLVKYFIITIKVVEEYTLVITQLALSFILFIFVILSKTDPGKNKVVKKNDEELLKIILKLKGDYEKFCPVCEVFY